MIEVFTHLIWSSGESCFGLCLGRLIGLYYDESGQPTEAMREFERGLAEGRKARQADQDDMKKFPPCNFESKQGEYRRIWCSTMRYVFSNLNNFALIQHDSMILCMCPLRGNPIIF